MSNNKIDKLTDEQTNLIPAFYDAWIKNALSTDPIDHKAVERGFKLSYATIALPPPKVLWLSSPLKGAIAATTLSEKLGETINKTLWTNELERAKKVVEEKVSPRVIKIVKRALMDAIAEETAAVVIPLALELEQRASALKMDGAEEVVRELLMAAVFGGFDAAWFSFYDYMERVLGIKEFGPKGHSRLKGLIRSTKSGWYWPFKSIVIATEHPIKILRDVNKKPHAKDTTAIEYSDGFATHAWHGVRVSPESISSPDSVTWKDVEETAETDLKDALAEIKALKWSESGSENESKDEKYDAAMAVKRLGGLEGLKGLTE